jgi:hypothetical protein
MHLYKVGELYNPNRTKWPETPQYNFRNGQHELLIFLNSPTPSEVESVKKGEAHFAFAFEGEIIFLMYKFDPEVPWSDCSFTIHLLPEPEQILPGAEATAQTRAIVSVILIDAATGVIKVMRQMTFSPDFTRKLHKAIREQASQPFDGARYGRAVNSLMAKFKTGDLLKRAVATTRGGE